MGHLGGGWSHHFVGHVQAVCATHRLLLEETQCASVGLGTLPAPDTHWGVSETFPRELGGLLSCLRGSHSEFPLVPPKHKAHFPSGLGDAILIVSNLFPIAAIICLAGSFIIIYLFIFTQAPVKFHFLWLRPLSQISRSC